MTDREKIERLKLTLEALAVSEMGAFPRAYEAQVQYAARNALAGITDTTPQD